MGLLVLFMLAFPLWLGIFDWLIAAGLLTVALLGLFAIHFFGLARQNPVALRMDANGLSGYYADPAAWDEIKSVFAFTGHKSHRFLGVALRDPVAFRDRQSPWRRYLSWANGRQQGAHLVVPQLVIADTTVDDLADAAQHFLADQRG